MRMLLLLGALIALPIVSAQAAERRYAVTNFERVRVDGPFRVEIKTGGPPRATAEGEQTALGGVSIIVEGDILIVRRGEPGAATPTTPRASSTRLPMITLSTPVLRAANVNAGGTVRIDAMRGSRIDLSVNGSGSLSVARIDAELAITTITGAGAITLAGKASSARFLVSGPGSVAADGLIADALFVRSDGSGEVAVAARYTADITTTGVGSVRVAGHPRCTVRSTGGGAVSCMPIVR